MSDETVEQPITGLGGAINIKSGAKGTVPTISTTPGVSVDPTTSQNVLENMRKLAEQLDDPLAKLGTNLKEMSAWTKYDKAPAFQQVEAEKEARRSGLYNIRQQLAAFDASQKQTDAINKTDAAAGWGMPSTGGTSAPGTDADVIAQYNQIKATQGVAAADKFRSDIIKKRDELRYGLGVKPEGVSTEVKVYDKQNNNALTSVPFLEFQNNPGRYSMTPGGAAAAPSAAVTSTGGTNINAAAVPKFVSTPAGKTAMSLGTTAGDFTPEELNRLINTESSKDPYAINKESKAMGLGQFTPETLIRLHKQGIKFDPLDPVQARTAALNELNRLSKELGSKELALAAYGGFNQKDPTPYISKILVSGPAKTTAPVVQTSGAVRPPPAPTGNRLLDLQNMENYNKQVQSDISASQKGAEKSSEADSAMKTAYLESVNKADTQYNNFDDLFKNSVGNKKVFNLAGQGWTGPISAKITPKLHMDETENDAMARTWLDNENKGHFDKIKKGTAVAQADFAKNLVTGAGNRLTNADLKLGETGKGVGANMTYEAHMQNLAKNMEDARTVFHRGQAFKDWLAKNPNSAVSEFENTDYYLKGSRIDAARDIANKFKDIPEAGVVHKAKDGRSYFIVQGTPYFL